MVQQIWNEMDLKSQFDEGSDRPKQFRDALKQAIRETCPELEELISKGILIVDCYIENFYARTVHNFGFNGDPQGLPIEVSYRLFELFIFF